MAGLFTLDEIQKLIVDGEKLLQDTVGRLREIEVISVRNSEEVDDKLVNEYENLEHLVKYQKSALLSARRIESAMRK